MSYIILYLLFGTIWLAWMEFYTTKYKIGPAWNNKERITQILIWPLAFAIFLKELYNSL